MRDRLAHRYFDTSHAIVTFTIANDLPELEAAAIRMTARSKHDGINWPHTTSCRARSPFEVGSSSGDRSMAGLANSAVGSVDR